MVRLRRGPAALTVYGVGGMLGGGIYALVGQVAANAGTRSWLAFALAMLVAAPTALVYAELAGRFPKSGGEAWFCQVAFERVAVARLVGWAVLLSGVVSMATLARAFAGYVADLAPGAPAWLVAPAFLAGLAAINLRGIRLSSLANVVCTVVEVAGLVVVVLAGALLLAGGASVRAESPPPPAGLGVLQGAALAFYAFIGFEDMVNVAEEVRRPARAYARAIPTALVAVGCVYGAVAWSSTAAVGPAVLAASDAPLSEVVAASALPIPRPAFSVVALFAVANSALLNSVMASRLTYGMAGRDSAESAEVLAGVMQVPPVTMKAYFRMLLGLDVSTALDKYQRPILYVGTGRQWPDDKPWPVLAKERGFDRIAPPDTLKLASSWLQLLKDHPDSMATAVATKIPCHLKATKKRISGK